MLGHRFQARNWFVDVRIGKVAFSRRVPKASAVTDALVCWANTYRPIPACRRDEPSLTQRGRVLRTLSEPRFSSVVRTANFRPVPAPEVCRAFGAEPRP